MVGVEAEERVGVVTTDDRFGVIRSYQVLQACLYCSGKYAKVTTDESGATTDVSVSAIRWEGALRNSTVGALAAVLKELSR